MLTLCRPAGKRRLAIAVLALLLPCRGLAAWPARSLATLGADGFVLRRVLPLAGDYDGCRRHGKLPLRGGGAFWCDADSFRYVSRPTARLLVDDATGERVLWLDGEELSGTLERVPGLPPHYETGRAGADVAPKPDFPFFPITGGVLATQPILPGAPGIASLDPEAPAIAPFHDDGQPRRNP